MSCAARNPQPWMVRAPRACMCSCACVCHAHVHVYLHVYMHVYMRVYMHVQLHVRVQLYVHVYAHVHLPVSVIACTVRHQQHVSQQTCYACSNCGAYVYTILRCYRSCTTQHCNSITLQWLYIHMHFATGIYKHCCMVSITHNATCLLPSRLPGTLHVSNSRRGCMHTQKI